MAKVKEMPYSEKYAMVIDSLKSEETFTLPYVQKHLGEQAMAELKKTWQDGFKPIEEGASFEEKYEVAYGNWIWSGKSTFSFIRRQLGEDGLDHYNRATVEALKRKNASPVLLLLRLVRAISPGSAFKMTAKQMAYQLQWLTPFSVSELTRHKLVLYLPRCKILDFPDTEDICVIGCQSMYRMWLADQFKVRMEAEVQGNSCTLTLTPLAQ